MRKSDERENNTRNQFGVSMKRSRIKITPHEERERRTIAPRYLKRDRFLTILWRVSKERIRDLGNTFFSFFKVRI